MSRSTTSGGDPVGRCGRWIANAAGFDALAVARRQLAAIADDIAYDTTDIDDG